MNFRLKKSNYRRVWSVNLVLLSFMVSHVAPAFAQNQEANSTTPNGTQENVSVNSNNGFGSGQEAGPNQATSTRSSMKNSNAQSGQAQENQASNLQGNSGEVNDLSENPNTDNLGSFEDVENNAIGSLNESSGDSQGQPLSEPLAEEDSSAPGGDLLFEEGINGQIGDSAVPVKQSNAISELSDGSKTSDDSTISTDSEIGMGQKNSKSLQSPANNLVGVSADSELVLNEFTGSPMMPGAIKSLADGEVPDGYDVLRGDTLIDICDQLLDEPGYWPKLWSYNPEIRNPHFILPRMKLRFYSGDDDTPPFLEVSEGQNLNPFEGDSKLTDALLTAAPLPPMKQVLNYSMDPESIVDITEVNSDGSEIDYFGAPRLFDSIRVQIPAFIWSQEKEVLGKVLGGIIGGINSGVGEIISIEDQKELSAGTVYTVLRPSGKVYTAGNDFVGYRYEHVGTVKVLKKLDDQISQGQVMETFSGVQISDILVPFISSQRSVPISNSMVGGVSGPGEVVGFDSEGALIGGSGSFVYLFGSSSTVGSTINIFRNNQGLLSMDKTNNFESSSLAAVAKIIDNTDGVVTGYIMNSVDAVSVGDRSETR